MVCTSTYTISKTLCCFCYFCSSKFHLLLCVVSQDSSPHGCVVPCYYAEYFLKDCFKLFPSHFFDKSFNLFFGKGFLNNLSHFSELFLMSCLWTESRNVVLNEKYKVHITYR